MSTLLISPEEVLGAYDEIWPLYPHVPSMNMWRAWEVAAYRRHIDVLREPVLDVGCGDGRFFRLIYPDLRQVTGVDLDESAVRLARASGVYSEVVQGPADMLSFADRRFGGAFANCSLEHMDHLPAVLAEVHRTLRPGASFVFSVVTDKFVDWAPLPILMQSLGVDATADSLRAAHRDYHHLVNPLPTAEWARLLSAAGFSAIQHTPIMPQVSSRIFLGLDQLWHAPLAGGEGEIGGPLHGWLSQLPAFPQAFRHVLKGLLEMEVDPDEGCGAVFVARRPG